VKPVVIGVDGSPAAERALRRGLQEALQFELDALVIHVWLPTPYSAGLPWVGAPFPAAVQEHIEADRRTAAQELERRIAWIQAEERAVAVDVTCRTREGMVAAVLLEEAADAHTLVIGARGHGGFSGLLLGSVSDQCVRHAHCPVLVVPAPDDGSWTPPGTRLPESLNR
jgi:nucleotide-binding universal stress UspA family protein